jgi:cellulose synthase/poly-beta-1,6-N-acetylglucosamine synthase-like glycosyltransferase
MNIAWFFLCMAVFLGAMGTFLAPILAIVFSFLRGKRPEAFKTVRDEGPISLDVLIPAHNEPDSLPASIEVLKKIRARSLADLKKMQIIVGLSHWSGPEATQASKEADVVLEIPEAGKWQAIKSLVNASTADWVALVDAGVVWEEHSLEILRPLFLEKDVVAINPRFQELKGGSLQKFIWKFESRLKLLENKSGGPISLHGATIFFRREQLQEALRNLQGTDWLNDDVVLPLTLRTLFPEMRIVYSLQTAVTDLFPSWDTPELQRRKRLLLGNIQWVQRFYWRLLRTDPVVGLLASRRVARMVWAWWFVCAGLGGLFLTHSLAGPAVLAMLMFTVTAVTLLLLRTASGRRLFEAFRISLAFPFYFSTFRSKGSLPRWK